MHSNGPALNDQPDTAKPPAVGHPSVGFPAPFRKILPGYLLALALAGTASGSSLKTFLQSDTPPVAQPYKTVGGTGLPLYVFPPAGPRDDHRRPAVVCIHGGAWVGGTPDVFFPYARYFASRGAVGFSIGYRLVRPEGPVLADAVADCKSAIRYIRAHAAEFGVDPGRIAVAGDSAGGHLAACLGTIAGFDDPADDPARSAVPDAMILYNAITDLTDGDWIKFVIGGAALAKHPAAEALQPTPAALALARALSPVFNVRPHQPPTLIMHGLDDHVVTPEQSRRFAEAMKQAGNACDLELVEGARHAFVVPNYTASEATVVRAMRAADSFLVGLGYLSGQPTLEVSPEPAWPPRTK